MTEFDYAELAVQLAVGPVSANDDTVPLKGGLLLCTFSFHSRDNTYQTKRQYCSLSIMAKAKRKKQRPWKIVQGKKPQPTKVRTDTLYHGTSSVHLASIKKHGITPAGKAGLGATGSRSWAMSGGSRYDMIGFVGVTDRTRSAAFYAGLYAGRKSHRPVIFDIDKRKLKRELLVRRRGSSVGGGKEWDYPRWIPPSALRGYWVYLKIRGKRKQWVYKRRPR